MIKKLTVTTAVLATLLTSSFAADAKTLPTHAEAKLHLQK